MLANTNYFQHLRRRRFALLRHGAFFRTPNATIAQQNFSFSWWKRFRWTRKQETQYRTVDQKLCVLQCRFFGLEWTCLHKSRTSVNRAVVSHLNIIGSWNKFESKFDVMTRERRGAGGNAISIYGFRCTVVDRVNPSCNLLRQRSLALATLRRVKLTIVAIRHSVSIQWRLYESTSRPK